MTKPFCLSFKCPYKECGKYFNQAYIKVSTEEEGEDDDDDKEERNK